MGLYKMLQEVPAFAGMTSVVRVREIPAFAGIEVLNPMLNDVSF